MPAPGSILGCPPGLEYLAQLDQVLIKQEASLLEGNIPAVCVALACLHNCQLGELTDMPREKYDSFLKHKAKVENDSYWTET